MARSLRNPKKAKRKNKKKENGESSVGMPARVWQPGVDKLEEGEELQCDPTAYNLLHAFHLGWPCLSFDIVRDTLGMLRTDFPHTLYCVAGTQAEKASWNYIGISKLSNISGKKRNLVSENGNESDREDSDASSSSSDEEEENEENGGPKPPVLQACKLFFCSVVKFCRPENWYTFVP